MLRSSRQRLSGPNGVVKVKKKKNSIGCQFSMKGSVTERIGSSLTRCAGMFMTVKGDEAALP